MTTISNSRTHHPRHFRRCALAIAIGAQLAALPALAEEVVETNAVETIVVYGQAASIKGALDAQQDANNVKSVVHADDIGQLPDNNAAEALQRIPGISVERDQGEGRYVRVRGLAPELNAVTINGNLVPAPEGGTRAVMLDVVPSDMVQALEVSKTLTPDMDASSLGGTIEVKTLSGFDHKGLFATVEAAGSHDTNTEEESPKFSGTVSNQLLDGKLAIAAGVSWESRDFGSDNVETGGAWDGNTLEEFERRDYLIERERLGTAFNLDWRPAEGQEYHLRTMLSQFTDSEIRQKHAIEFDDAQLAGELGDAEATRELKDREEEEEILSIALGTTQQFGPWKVSAELAHGQSHEDTPYHIATAAFAGTGTFTDTGFTNGKKPKLSGPASLYSAASYELDEVEMEEQFTEDTANSLQLDLGRDLTVGSHLITLKTGIKHTAREKENDTEVFTFGGGGESMTGFTSGTVDYALGNFGPALSSGAVMAWLNGQDRSAAREDVDSAVGDYQVNEDITAAYLQASLTRGNWWLLAGLRMEDTSFSAEGSGYDDDTGSFLPVDEDHDYTHFLPGLHMRYDLNDQSAIRASWSNSVVRPTFDQLRPGFSREGSVGSYEAEAGNPRLDAMESANLDVGYEWRMDETGLLSAYVFGKDINNFVYSSDQAGVGKYVGYAEAITYENGDEAHVYGLELAASKRFGGFLLGANLTVSDSEATIAQGGTERDIALPSQSDLTANITVGYEIRQLSLRLATNYKSDYLLELGSDILDKTQEIHVDDQTHVDFTAAYNVMDELQLGFDILNLTDEPYYTYQGKSSRNAQYEEYGQTYRLGVKYTYR